MDFSYSPKVIDLQQRLTAFMEAHIYPAERVYHHEVDAHRKAGNAWQPTQVMEELKAKARAAGLWNLFLPAVAVRRRPDQPRIRAAVRDHGPLAHRARGLQLLGARHRQHGRCWCATARRRAAAALAASRCSTATIRSAFAMTEPDVASSDATNIEARIVRDGDDYVINGRKWWTSGAPDPRCEILIFMGKTDPDNPSRHRQQSMILVPMKTPGRDDGAPAAGLRLRRRAARPRARSSFENVRVPVGNMLLGEGRGFEIAQGRLGPGRIHHCMRLIGVAERALELMCRRALSARGLRHAAVAEQGVTRERIANARILIDQARLLVLNAAHMMDTVGNKAAQKEIAMIKVAAPNMACQVIDWAIQVHGGGGRQRRLSARCGLCRRRARCASPTAPTRCTATRSARWNWPATRRD